MEGFAAGVTLLLLFGLLSGGGVVAATCDYYESSASATTKHLRGAANQLAAAATAAAACTTHSAHVSTAGATSPGRTCDAPLLVSQLTKFCKVEMDAPSAVCCAAVLLTVEQNTGCLCRVADAAEFILSDLSVARVWDWYKSCGGRRRSVPQDEDSCKPDSAPPPPPPAKPEAPSAWPLRLWVAVGLLCVAAIVTVITIALKLWLWLRPTVQAAVPQCQRARLNMDQEVEDAATIGLPQATSGPGDARLRADEDSANPTATKILSREEVSPPPSPLRLRVEGMRSQQARARARSPSPPPFEPLPPPVYPPPFEPPPPPPPVYPPVMSPPLEIRVY